MIKNRLIGPFTQLLTMNNIPLCGSLIDNQLEIIPDGGVIVCGGKIVKVGNYDLLGDEFGDRNTVIDYIDSDMVVIPGMIDPHTHICWAGSRANDYALRLAGKSYLEIALGGGGIGDTVQKTRLASPSELEASLTERALNYLQNGVTTIEVKSGYCLNTEGELKLLDVIEKVNKKLSTDLIPTCLAAHIKPSDFRGTQTEYLESVVSELLPEIKKRNLSNRIDIYIDKGAFTTSEARMYLNLVKDMGFDFVVHGDQFTEGGVEIACELGALSVDHLEMMNDDEIKMLARSKVIPIVLPGSSLGLGGRFAPARKLLDAGCSLAIGSDWNPGSAPMGDLLLQTAILGIFEKMTMAESLAGITFRAARALNLTDRGVLKAGFLGDMAGFPVDDYREIIYHQGSLNPSVVWKRGQRQ